MTIELTDTQRYLLHYYTKEPFITLQALSERLGYSDNSAASANIRTSGMNRNQVFVALGWIDPKPIDYDSLAFDIRPGYRKLLDLMQERPVAPLSYYAEKLGVSVKTIGGYRSDLYQMFGVSQNAQVRLLKLYHALGWYEPRAEVLEG